MYTRCEIIFSLWLLVFTITIANSKLIIREITVTKPYHLDSSEPEIDYPNNPTILDVVWVFNHSVRLDIKSFNLDGHRGDFVLISDLPLINIPELSNITGEDYNDQLAKAILTDQGLLLSWQASNTIQIVNPRGTFVLFHAEAKSKISTAEELNGFVIEVINYDDAMGSSTTTTPDPPISEDPNLKIYIQKYLSCMPPKEFFRNKNDFKEKIATIANAYCKEFEANKCDLENIGDITKEDVNIPATKGSDYAGVHYCDPRDPKYDTCVEVNFAIPKRNSTGYYILPADKLDVMWQRKSKELEKYGYCPYTPPKLGGDFLSTAWVWAAFFVGIIFGLLVLVCASFTSHFKTMLSRPSFSTKNTREVLKRVEKIEKEQMTVTTRKHFDAHNPIYRFIRSSDKTPREDLFRTNEMFTPDDEPERTSTSYITTTGADVHGFDNDGFEKENDASSMMSDRTEYPDEYPKMSIKRSTVSEFDI